MAVAATCHGSDVGVLHLTDEKRAVLYDTFGPWLDLYNLDDYGQFFGGSTS